MGSTPGAISQPREVQDDGIHRGANALITAYLEREVPQFRRLRELRRQGWQSSAGDSYFEAQRHRADNCDGSVALFFFDMMKSIARDMQHSADCLRVERPPCSDARILDCCMAPGGFLSVCLELNPGHHALAFTLPVHKGGHEVLLSLGDGAARTRTEFLDLTMLAADVGVKAIPTDHPDATNFLPRQLAYQKTFDLVICDGQVLRTHQRASYREKREARRLILSQLILGLEHISPGGTMIVLLHKLEAFNAANLLHRFSKFASLKLYKSTKFHAKRSSFYLIASSIQPDHPEALSTLSIWKKSWHVATFGSDEEHGERLREEESGACSLLESYGTELVRLGSQIWDTQAAALARMPWTRKV